MKHFPLIFLSAIFLLPNFTGCGASTDPTPTTATELLLGCWVHHYEEDPSANEKVYKNCAVEPLPPSRFRARYEFQVDGICSFLVLAPNDAHYQAQGTWTHDSTSRQVIIRDEQGSEVTTFEIIALTEEQMLIRE